MTRLSDEVKTGVVPPLYVYANVHWAWQLPDIESFVEFVVRDFIQKSANKKSEIMFYLLIYSRIIVDAIF